MAIDDAELMRALVSEVLLSAGYTPIVAGNGSEGIACFKTEQPDVVITDAHNAVVTPWSSSQRTARCRIRSP